MYKYLPLIFIALLSLAGCKPKPIIAEVKPVLQVDESFKYEAYEVEDVQRPEEYTFKRGDLNYAHYIPDTEHPRYLPMRYLRVNFHIMNSTDTFYRFFGEEANDYLYNVMNHTSDLIKNTPEIWLQPDSMDVPALPRRVYFGLGKKANGEYAIYEHYDDELYFYHHKGKDVNRSSREVINKYAIDKDSMLNIFIMGPSREKLAAGYKLTGTDGIYLGDAIKVTGMLSRDRPAWEMDGVIAHEIAHGLGLYHAWTARDGCDDTPKHNNDAWTKSKADSGPGKTSNNLMDYSNLQESLTPCQIGRMHARMSDITGRQRKWLLPYWCTYNPNEPVRVTNDLNLEGARDYNTDIYVKRGATLRINNRIHLPGSAAIHVDPGGRLIIGPKAVIHSECGGQWDGIRVGVTEGGIRGEVEVDPLATFLNERS
ncbi:MAG: hypothetical protein ACJAZ9_001301 [Neolewinella sp.]|jgi:hypothetical protein